MAAKAIPIREMGGGCPTYHLSESEMLSEDFLSFAQRVFRHNPDIPAFKIVPPDSWKPLNPEINVDGLVISCPIQQLAFGKTGSYRCLLVEQRVCCWTLALCPRGRYLHVQHKSQGDAKNNHALTVAAFRDLANSEAKRPPSKCSTDLEQLQRHFWKSVTINPPIYGADTPLSLFRENCGGWNLANIPDLLKEKRVPPIPGVTSPMTYFGMWKSFFAWHVEDADLYSVNYLHWGAPKIWYCVSPKDKARFERAAGTLHPDQQRLCKGFLRHKDILISPTILKQFGVKYEMCYQHPGEYVVLNAAAYHSGFNCGYNAAEAVNFATEAWIQTGKKAIQCTCSVKDRVKIDMKLFDADGASTSCSSEASDVEDGSATTQPVSPLFTSTHDTSGKKRTSNSVREGCIAGHTGEDTAPVSKQGRQSCTSRAAAKPLRSAAMKLGAARKIQVRNESLMEQLSKLAKPCAIVYGHEHIDKPFELVIPLENEVPSSKNMVLLQALKQGKDGLYRPCRDVFEVQRSALVTIRTQLVDPGANKPGFKLLTLRSRILGTELVD